MANESESKKLNDLKVVDLRTELEKRDLDKTGVKAQLLQRLQKALKDEGHDPETYVFDLSDAKRTPVRGKKSDNDEASEDDKGDEEKDNIVSTSDENKESSPEKKVVNSDTTPEKSQNEEKSRLTEDKETVEVESEVKGSTQETPKKAVSEEKVEEAKPNFEESVSKKNESVKEEMSEEKQKPKEQTVVKTSADTPSHKTPDTSTKEEKPEANGIIDNEDSINLTIGEDEAKLLADEEESSQEKDHKDESHGSSGVKKTGEKNQDKTNSEKTDGKSSQGGDKANKDDKNKKPTVNSTSKNLWVSGLATTTRATDLKQVFSKYGKVIGAKVVTNARMPGARCYGYVTMSNVEDANKAVQLLHHTELHGRLISVEKAKADSSAGPPAKRPETVKTETAPKKVEEKKKEPVRKTEPKKEENIVPPGTEGEVVKEPAAPGTEEAEKKESKDTTHRSRELVKSTERPQKRPRSTTSSHGHRRGGSPLSFEKIKEERERQRLREKERMLREEQRRRETERLRQREIDRKQREEFERLEREKKKLKMERERLLKEKDDLMKLRMERQRLERERQKLERERLEKEKEELERLKRQTLRLEEETRRKRSLSASRDREYEARKRQATDTRYVHHSSSQSRYPEPPSRSSEYKKEMMPHKSSTREIIQTVRRPGFEPDTTRRLVTTVSSSSRDPWISKERESGRYERTSVNSSNFRDDSMSSHKPTESRHVRERYQEGPKAERFVERGGDWRGGSSGGSAPIKSFSSRDTWVSGSSDRKQEMPEPWARPNNNSNRWQGNSGGRGGPQSGVSNSFFPVNNMQTVSSLGMGVSTIGSFSGGDRFDAYKQPYFKGN